MGLKYIRDYYGVPAKRGVIIEYTGGESPSRGVIVGARAAYLRIRMDGEKLAKNYHPDWKIRYLGAKK